MKRRSRVEPYAVPRWMAPALQVLRPKKRLPVSAWAEANRILPDTNAVAGPWRNALTPYLVEIMDAFSDDTTEQIVFIKPTQVGGTSAMENALGSLIDQDPGPTMVVYPSDQLAKRTVESKLEPMFKSCPALAAKYRAHESEDLAQRFDGMTVYLTGANSPADLSSTPIRYLFLDEVDKYPGSTKKESDPVSLAVERTKSYRLNRKIFMASTPTLKTGLIWRAKEAAEAEKHYFVPCPHCGAYIELKFAQLKWPSQEEEPDLIQWARRVRYVCQECGCILTDRDKPAMLRAGRWQFVRRDSETPRSVAFWMNTLYSPFTTFEEVAREFLKVKDDPEMLHNFVNSWLAEPWEDTKLKTSAELVLERQTETPAWQLPPWTKLLTGGIDVQENSIYWTIRAWGDHMTSQNVAHGQALSGEELEQVMSTVFPLPSGGSMMVELALMDSGDQTDAIYEFCLLHSDWVIPSKGSSKALPGFYRVSTIDKAGSKAYGLQLVLVDTGKYKDMISARMRRPNGSGSWMVHKDCDLDYAQQVTSEHKITERSGSRQVQRWVVKSTHADNHYLDCEVYAACAADLKNVRSLYWYVYEGADSIDPAVSIPESVMGGDTIQITLTPSEGKVYGGNVSYLYESKLDEGEWTAIATTAETTQSLLVPKGTNTVQLRVRAQDDMGFVSEDYVLSAAVSVINNLPPTAPGSIQAANVIQDEEATITLTAASDPDGQVVSYIYERSHDDGEWEQIADVNSLTCTDRVGEWAVVAYRAKAVDNEGASGPYAATETQDVNVNYVYIGGPGEELGPKPAPFPLELLVNVSGTSRVTDISVRAALDGKSIYTGTPDGGETIALEIDTRLLGAGEHTVEVQASKDDYLPASKRYTFNVPAVVLPDGGVGALAQDPNGRAVFHTTLAQRCIGRDGVDIQAQMDALAAQVKTLEG